ncbi:hypothetical protein [Acetanaerobacterium elongatum]|uniref:Uncharacterized protein n=1 Tax=Acetanaerobacterium elongatum TaxID=258515 RepID=A0A1H0GIG0_9FIRM|nr:hypothetical protein [Acetanaerobacterium elongatum]SDO06727.1 hypothetical protein SAMN05192585_15113 [Acetanaerobacterium elongatum]
MLEILLLMLLCKTNKKNALARGRKPGGFIALTIILWLVLEFVGAFIGAFLDIGYGIYVMALLFAGTGALISYLAAKNCKPGNFVAQEQVRTQEVINNAQPLLAPIPLTIVREGSLVGAAVSWSFSLNGQPVGSLGNGKAVTLSTAQRQNVLSATDVYGFGITPYYFDVQDGVAAEVHFKAGKFLPGQSVGVFAATTPVPMPES